MSQLTAGSVPEYIVLVALEAAVRAVNRAPLHLGNTHGSSGDLEIFDADLVSGVAADGYIASSCTMET